MSIVPTKTECTDHNKFIAYTVAIGIVATIILTVILLIMYPIPMVLLLLIKTSSAWIV